MNIVNLENCNHEFKTYKTEADYQNTLKRLDEVFDAPTNSKEGDEAEVLIELVDDFENKYYPII